MSEKLQAGMLVRYDETTTRWFLAVIREVRENQVELEYLSGYRETVPAKKVTPFVPYLQSRESVLSLKRDDLCYVLYGEVISRLRQDRVRKMQKFLRFHGLRFIPDQWSSGSRIQIRHDDSFIEARTSDPDRAYDALLPRWLEPHRLPPGSRDPLGFQSHAEKIADEFLPGLTVFTTRIGYYGFIAWAVRELNSAVFSRSVSRRGLFHRLERALALCEFINHGKENNYCRLLGQRSKSEVLQSAENNRFSVPKRILKNQDSAGSLRLYSTSIVKNGFAKMVPEQAVDNLLPFALTELGEQLARAFEKHVPNGFFEFALDDKKKDRDELRKWGDRLCFFELGKFKHYREPFLEGFLLGGGAEAEARYRTTKLLFSRKILRDDYTVKRALGKPLEEFFSEEEAALEEDLENEGLADSDVLLQLYEGRSSPEVMKLQKAAVFELLSLGHTSIFAHVIDCLEYAGRVSVKELLDSILSNKSTGQFWRLPMDVAGRKAATARVLVEKLFTEESVAVRAAIGGTLLARVRADACLGTVAVELAGTPVITLLEALPTDRPMGESYDGLLQAMVARHEQVSLGKNRQRWCYLDSGEVVKDDLRPLGVGWHAMRFRQLYSLCHDLRLQKGELAHGD